VVPRLDQKCGWNTCEKITEYAIRESSNGRTPAFGTGYQGSNPCSRTKRFYTLSQIFDRQYHFWLVCNVSIKRSPIWKMPKEQFATLVAASRTTTQILKAFGLQNKGNNNRTVHKRLKEDGLSIDHLLVGVTARIACLLKEARPLETLLRKGTQATSSYLKKRLIKEGLMQERCVSCPQTNEWNGQRLVLVLDHINGDPTDNRLENLRLLCPNCNSQTPTFAGKNVKRAYDKGKRIDVKTDQNRQTKFEICSSSLARRIANEPITTIAKDFGVSDKAVRKRCLKFGIVPRPRGFWAKQKARIAKQ